MLSKREARHAQIKSKSLDSALEKKCRRQCRQRGSRFKGPRKEKISFSPHVSKTELVSLRPKKGGGRGAHVNAGWLVPLILRGVVDLPMRTWFNLGGNAG